MAGPRPAAVETPGLPVAGGRLRQPGEQGQQQQGAQQRRAEDAAEAAQLGQLGAGVHVHKRAGQHADLAGEIEAGGPHRRQRHQQIHQKKREHRRQPQAEQVEHPIALHAGFDRGQLAGEAPPHQIPQQGAGHQEGKQGAQAGGKRHQQGAEPHAEDRPTGQGEHRGPRQRQRRHQHINQHVAARHQQRRLRPPLQQGAMDLLEALKGELAVQAQSEEQHHHQGDGGDQQGLAPARRAGRRGNRRGHGGGASLDLPATPWRGLAGRGQTPNQTGGWRVCPW